MKFVRTFLIAQAWAVASIGAFIVAWLPIAIAIRTDNAIWLLLLFPVLGLAAAFYSWAPDRRRGY